MQWPIIPFKNLTSLFPLIFLSKHISVYALGRRKWILDIIWPFELKNQRNWLKQVWMLKFCDVIICIVVHSPKKLTLNTYRNISTSCRKIQTTSLGIIIPIWPNFETSMFKDGCMISPRWFRKVDFFVTRKPMGQKIASNP